MNCETITERMIGKAKILIAENNYVQACLMKDFLELSGHDVILSRNGASVLRDVEMHRPDVILLDRMMHDADGTTICRKIKRNRDTSGIPIIMVTEQSSLSDKISGLAAGADDFISKPYNDEELSALICARLRAKTEWDDLKRKTRNLEEMLTRVEALAHIDPLTGFFNRRHFESVFIKEFKRAERYQVPLSCVMLDIDHFKQINDQHGHLAGDQVLRETVAIIQQTIREVDFAARWGGEEFIILNPNTEKNNALIVGEKIRKAMASHLFYGVGRKVTVSAGVAGIPHDLIQSPEDLIHAADLAMYRAKKDGRNRVVAAD